MPACSTTITTYNDPASCVKPPLPPDIRPCDVRGPDSARDFYLLHQSHRCDSFWSRFRSDIIPAEHPISKWSIPVRSRGTTTAPETRCCKARARCRRSIFTLFLTSTSFSRRISPRSGVDLWTTSSPGVSYSITVAGNTYTVPTLTGNTEGVLGNYLRHAHYFPASSHRCRAVRPPVERHSAARQLQLRAPRI